MREKRFEYVVALERDGTARAQGGSPAAHDLTWTPEHLLLAALVRCTVQSLGFHADREGIAVEADATATAAVTRPAAESRMRIVEVSCKLDVDLRPLPEAPAVEQLLADAEHDCFVGATLKPSTAYEWRVNGELRQPAGTPSGLRVPRVAPRTEAADARNTTPRTTDLACDRCGRPAPLGGSTEWRAWNPASISLDELTDPVAAHSLICPDCRAEEQSPEELGGGD